jgi:membrane-associated phospholipid phosphatase
MLLPVVLSTKKITSILRPDGSEYTSFPSGHTAFAFASAEFLRQEYKHKSPWYGIAGYTVATATAGLRIHNNKHWLADVAAGAGLGILSTQVAYWIHPWMSKKIFTKKNSPASLLPQISTEQIGIVFQARF